MKKRRWLSLLLCFAMVLSLFPTTALAEGEETAAQGLCPHHTVHTNECGYVAAAEEQPCAHVHGSDCYTQVTVCQHTHTAECYSDGILPAAGEEKAADTCGHACSVESGCITEELNCQHTHDEACGYAPATEGAPCGYVCESCNAEDGGEPSDPTNTPDSGDPSDPSNTQNALMQSITAWAWVDEDENLSYDADKDIWVLALPGASETNPALQEDIVALLPAQITATLNKGQETLSLDGWMCESYPDAGAGSGSYTFTAALPEGYELDGDAPALAVTVELGGASLYATVRNIQYLDADGSTKRANTTTVVESNSTTWSGGWYVVNKNVTIGSQVTVSGNVYLILADGCTLTVNGSIQNNGSLTIYGQSGGTGKLTAAGSDGQGGDYNASTPGTAGSAGIVNANGTITINGGTVTATGGNGGGGYNGGKGGDGGAGGTGIDNAGGTITINRGTVTATGGNGGGGGMSAWDASAGAGSAGGDGIGGENGTITISGGTVIATGGTGGDGSKYNGYLPAGTSHSGGAGISGTLTVKNGSVEATGGAGGEGSSNSSGHGGAGISGPFTIESGSVTASGGKNGTGGTNGAGISGGDEAVTIIGGEVTATGGYGGAGISSQKSIAISGGKVTAIGGENGAGIGCGDKSAGGTITISGGTVTATGGYCGAGIGGGNKSAGGIITISGGKVTAIGGYRGAGIGGGNEGEGGQIQIEQNATVEATGGIGGAGIGGGAYRAGGTITISGGTVTASCSGYDNFVDGMLGGAGIGGGGGTNSTAVTSGGGAGGSITITGGNVTATGGYYAAGIGGGSKGVGGTVEITDGTVTANGGQRGAGIGGGAYHAGGIVNINGGTVTAIGGGNGGAGIGGGNSGASGTFTTGTQGDAILIIASSIADQGSKTSWHGIIFAGDEGQVYGTTVTPDKNFDVPDGKTLLIPEDSTLNISGRTIVNNGSLYVAGKLNGTPDSTSTGKVYYRLTIEGEASDEVKPGSGTSAYNGNTYGQVGGTVSLTVTNPVGRQIDLTLSDAGTTLAQDNSFTMPAEALTVTAAYKNVPAYTVTIPAQVSIGGTAQITAEQVNVSADSLLNIALSESSFTLQSADGEQIPYTVTNGGQTLKAGDSVLSVAGGKADHSGAANLSFALAEDAIVKYSGTYTGTVTFRVSVEDMLTKDENGVYQIRYAADLETFRDRVNSGERIYFDAKLLNDINLNGSETNQWTPIGSDSFADTFDGGGHTISGLYINSTDDYQGLFGAVDTSGTVKNLGVDGTVSGNEFVGGVVGCNGGRVTNCYNTGNVSGSNYVGGVVGYNFFGTVTNCYNTGNISGGNYVGGVGYYYSGMVTNCYYLDTCGASGVGTSLTAEQFAQQDSFTDWDFDTIWQMSDTLKRPILRSNPE